MSKETKTFIHGLILMIVCGLAVVIHLKDMVHGAFQGGVRWVFFLAAVAGLIVGKIKITEDDV